MNRTCRRLSGLCLVLIVGWIAGRPVFADDPSVGIRPTIDGRVLNFGFENGTLDDWTAEGAAFENQPVQGDTVNARRSDMKSEHAGEYWIGTFERDGDQPQGTLTSVPFPVTHPYASFLIAGGGHARTRVELVSREDGRVIFKSSAGNTENLRRVVVDLQDHVGTEIVIRIVDEASGGWGHINFDDFVFHEMRKRFAAEGNWGQYHEYAHAGIDADRAAEVMTVPEGFRVQLAASEPDVRQPIAMSIDDRGRLWVAEAYAYPRRAADEDARDRILIFTDVDGDGRFDERKVFYEGLNLVSGMEVGFGGVWVGAAPYFLFIPDAEGDDVPDGPPEILLDGWGYHDTHETLNAFIWGPDGWLYGCHGVFTHSKVGKPGTPEAERTPLNAGIWRYHPTRHEFEVFAHGTSNPWGVDFNDRGQAFATACVIPHLFHIIQNARYERQAGQHFNPYTYDDIKTIADHLHWAGERWNTGIAKSGDLGGGHAHCGAMIYLGATWPKEYRDQIFMNNIHGARINMDTLHASGSGYVGSHGPDFLMANDSWSQIINLRYGPDGNVYMIDWYDANQCHRGNPEVHDPTNGRIFKISYGESTAPSVNLAQLDDSALVDLQTHENDWYVRHARRLLAERQPGEAVHGALAKLAFEHADATRRLRGLWALHVSGGLTDERALRALDDADPYVRGWTIQLLCEDRDPPSTAMARFVALAAKDPSPVVRQYLASAALRLDVEKRWDLVTGLASHTDDADDHNLPLMVWYAAEPLVDVDASRALAIASESAFRQHLEFTVRRIGSSEDDGALATLIAGLNGTTTDDRARLFVSGITQALRGRRQVTKPEGWDESAKRLSESGDEQLRRDGLKLSVTFGDRVAMGELHALLQDTNAPADARDEALASLLGARYEALLPTVRRLLDDEALRGAAIRALAQFEDTEIAQDLLGRYDDMTANQRRDAINTLASRSVHAVPLLEAIAEERIRLTDVTADVVRQLKNLKSDEVASRIDAIWGAVRDVDRDKARLIRRYHRLLAAQPPQSPDVELGRAMFAKTCAQCHRLFGVGGDVGPELTGSNRANRDYLLSNVLDPSALMARDYMPVVVETTDGRVLTGLVREQTGSALTIRTANETVVIPTDEIEEQQLSDKSMMPDDLLAPLNDHEVRSLVSYLASPRQVPVRATADSVGTLFNRRDLAGWNGDSSLWTVEEGELVGRTSGLDHNEFLVSDISVGDFRLSVEVMLVDNRGNSGIQFRSRVDDDGHVVGYQADIGAGWWGKLYEEHGRGLLWKSSGEKHLKSGEWNQYEIVAVGDHVQTYLNGKLCVDLVDRDGAARGILALQLHSGPAMEVRFRNFDLRLADSLEDASPDRSRSENAGGGR